MGEPSDQPQHTEPSKTERKRQALYLQNLGKRLTEVKPDELATFSLTPKILDAIANYLRFKSHEARRRQLQYIGKLMRGIDLETLQHDMEAIDNASAATNLHFHRLEQWRDRLLSEPDALTEYLHAHPQAPRQALRHQLQRVAKAKDEAQRKSAARALFRLLKEFAQPA